MLQIHLSDTVMYLPYGLYSLGNSKYLVDARGIVKHNDCIRYQVICLNDGQLRGGNEDKIIHELELKALARTNE